MAATTVYFSYPDIPDRAIEIVTQELYSDFRPVFNLFKGHRHHHAELENNASSTRYIDFKLADDDLRTADHLIIARADLLINQGVTDITLQRSSDYSTWTTVASDTLSVANLTGPKSEDRIITFTKTSAYRYWRVYFTGGITKTRFSKLYLGNFYDIGTYPDFFNFTETDGGYLDFIADSGAAHPVQIEDQKGVITITWNGVSDAKADDLMNGLEVIRSNARGLFVYAPVQTQILKDDELYHVQLQSITKDDLYGYPNWNSITAIFKEQIG